MDLKSGYPYWAIKNGLMHAFPRLERDLACEIVVVGGGISGALVTHELATHGHEVCVVEMRDIGWGSTAASTALLQYEIDTPLTDLMRRYGEADAALAYRACADAVGLLQALAQDVGDVGFARTRSLYLASRPRDIAPLREELGLRVKHGLSVSWVDTAALHDGWGVVAPGAVISELAARVDPYRLTYRLLMRLQAAGVQVFDRTCIAQVTPGADGVTLRTADGVALRARHVVFATGYAAQLWLTQKVARNRSTYAFVTDPLPTAQLQGFGDTLLWETARPYVYLRSTDDRRVLIGGADDAVDLPARRDRRVRFKTRALQRKAFKLIPDLRLIPAFAWAGTFAETGDGLPFFGPHAQYGPRVHFAMAYGGNGITYSALGAPIIRALVERRTHRLLPLFSFERLRRSHDAA